LLSFWDPQGTELHNANGWSTFSPNPPKQGAAERPFPWSWEAQAGCSTGQLVLIRCHKGNFRLFT